MNLCFQHLVEA
jgi:hypothetical protein